MPPHTLSRSLLPIALLILIVAGVFGPSVRNQFVDWDDRNEIFQNPDFNPVTIKGLLWNWSNTRLSLYMPVTYMTWGAVAAISPREGDRTLKPIAFHGLNVALHLLCTVLVYLLILQLWHPRWPAFLGALAFGVHPLQVEAVAWASGMYTLLSSAFSLGALLLYAEFALRRKEMRTSNVQRPTSNLEINASVHSPLLRRWTLDVGRSTFAFFLIATALYILALLTKAASVSLPLAAVVIDSLIIGRPLKKVIQSLWLWVLLGMPIVVLAKHFQDVSVITAPPLWGRPVVALDAFGFYLRKMVLPTDLIPDYGRNPAWVMRNPALVYLSLLIAVCALFCAWIGRRHLKWLTASICLMIAGIFPYLGLTAFDFQYVSTVADRYAYFGMIGLAFFIAAAAVRSKTAAIAFALAVSIWSVLSFIQVQRWRDTSTLFKYTLNINSDSLVSHNVFGYMAAHQTPPDRATAEAHYLAALKIWPEDAVVRFNLGNLYVDQHPEMALEQYALAVKYQPNFVIYRNNLAAALDRLNRPQEAYDQWQQAIAIDPEYVDARNHLADMCAYRNQLNAARAEYLAVLQIDPNNTHALAKLKEMDERAR